jgi:hypothetical protein
VLLDELAIEPAAGPVSTVSEQLRMSAWTGRGETLLQAGNLDAALDAFRCVAVIAENIHDAERQACAFINQGYILRLQKKITEASALFAEQETRCRKLGYRFGLALCLGNWGNLRHEQGAIEAAITCYVEAEQLQREMGDIVALGKILLNHASALASLEGHDSEAEDKLEELARIYTARALPIPQDIKHHVERVQEILTRNAALQFQQSYLRGCEAADRGDMNETIRCFQRSLAGAEKLTGVFSDNDEFRLAVADLHENLADAYLATGRKAEAANHQHKVSTLRSKG